MPKVDKAKGGVKARRLTKYQNTFVMGRIVRFKQEIAAKPQMGRPGGFYRLTRKGGDMDTSAISKIRTGEDFVHGSASD